MQSFRETNNSLVAFLQEKLPGINVQIGQYGKMPTEIPCVLIYSTPASEVADSLGTKKYRLAKFTVFAIQGGNENIEDSIASSVELLETVEVLLNDFTEDFALNDESIKFDDIYDNNLAASYLEFFIQYKRHNQWPANMKIPKN